MMRSPSRSRRSQSSRRKRSRSTVARYNDSSDERTTPDRTRRRRFRDPSPPSPKRFLPDSHHRDDHLRSTRHRSKEVEKSHHTYNVLSITSLHPKATDEDIRDTLYKHFRRFGDLNIKISRDIDEKVAYVCFRSHDDAKSARHSKPRIKFFDKVASIKPVLGNGVRTTDDYRSWSRPRSRSISPNYDHYYKRSPGPERHGLLPDYGYERYYGPPHVFPYRDYRRDGPPTHHSDFMRIPPSPHGPLPPMLLGPHHYGPPRHMMQGFKPLPPGFERSESKKDKFPNYLHHVPPEDDPLATRTLFAGNLDINITEEELRNVFGRYGIVEDIDIKRPLPGTGNAYAFVRYQNLDMAHKSKVELSGQYIGKFQCKIGYGKATPTTRIWVGGLGSWTSLPQLEREFDRFGAIKKIEYNKADTWAYILYDSIDAAQAAVKEMRGFDLGGPDHKLRVDFAEVSPGLGYKARYFQEDYGSAYGEQYPEDEYSYGGQRGFRGRSSGRSTPDVRSTERPDLKDIGYHGEGSNKEERTERQAPNNQSERSSKHGEPSHIPVESSGSEKHINGVAAPKKSLIELASKFSLVWEGSIVLKNSLFPSKFYLIEGESEIVGGLSNLEEGRPLLRITQRLRLDNTRLDDVSKRIDSSSAYAIFLSLPGPLTVEETSLQTRPLKNLVSYLKQKDAAGVISLVSNEVAVFGVLYAFPPCPFSFRLLKKTSSDLTEDALKEEHMVIVVVRGAST